LRRGWHLLVWPWHQLFVVKGPGRRDGFAVFFVGPCARNVDIKPWTKVFSLESTEPQYRHVSVYIRGKNANLVALLNCRKLIDFVQSLVSIENFQVTFWTLRLYSILTYSTLSICTRR
jgi:hypothetical protein